MANDSLQFSLIGLDELLGKLDAISLDMKIKGGRFALRKAANLVANAAKNNAKKLDDPTTSENIGKNIAVRWSGRRFQSTGDLMFRIGVLGGALQYANSRSNRNKNRAGDTYTTDGDKTNPGGDTWYWRLHEFGTSKMRAQPFMRSALSENVNDATDEFITQYSKALDRAITRAGKKKS